MSAAAGTRKLAAARLWAVNRAPYLASALFALTLSGEPGLGTISIDMRWRIAADPDLVERLSVAELGRLLIHHCGHALRDHGHRAQALGVSEAAQRAEWNRAADAEINDDLAHDRLVGRCAGELPKDLGCEPGQLAEHYYANLRAGARRWDCGAGADGVERAGEGHAKSRASGRGDGLDGRQAAMLRLAVAAAIEGQPPGTVPGGWQRWAQSVLPSRTDWRRVLGAEIRGAVARAAGMVDYSYSRPSRRAAVTPELVLPTLVRPVPDVVIVCDTSGSMHERLLARALAEVEALLARAGLRQARVPVLAVDGAVQTVRRVARAREVALVGGGGTDMGEGISAAAALRPKPAVIIVLTDGYTPWPVRPPPGVRVIVGLLVEEIGDRSVSREVPPWARTVVIEER